MSGFSRWQVEGAIDDALGLLRLEGTKEKLEHRGHQFKIKTYVDPFGTDLIVRCGKYKGQGYKLLTVQLPDGHYLMRVKLWKDDTYEVVDFDTEISWTWPSLLGAYYDTTKRIHDELET